MTEHLESYIKDRAVKQVSKYPQLYEDNFSGVGDVTMFFSTAAELFLQKGWSEQEIIDKIDKSMGNYLLGKKYGVPPASYVSNCIEERERQSNNK